MVDNRKTKIGCMAYGKIEGKNTPDKCCQMAEAIWGGGGGGDGGGKGWFQTHCNSKPFNIITMAMRAKKIF